MPPEQLSVVDVADVVWCTEVEAGFSFLLKVVAVPLVTLRLLRRTDPEIANSRAFGVANMVLVAVSAFGFFASARFHLGSPVLPAATLSVAMAIVLVSFVLMIVRRDAVSQAIGFFALENGVSLASLVVAATLPLILEVAFLFDLALADNVIRAGQRLCVGMSVASRSGGHSRLRSAGQDDRLCCYG